MTSLELIEPWLKKNGFITTYDSHMDVTSFIKDGVTMRFFTVNSLLCLTHSEYLQGKGLDSSHMRAILTILSECIFARPVPRMELGKIKIKVVSENPGNLYTFLDEGSKDLLKAVLIYREFAY